MFQYLGLSVFLLAVHTNELSAADWDVKQLSSSKIVRSTPCVAPSTLQRTTLSEEIQHALSQGTIGLDDPLTVRPPEPDKKRAAAKAVQQGKKTPRLFGGALCEQNYWCDAHPNVPLVVACFCGPSVIRYKTIESYEPKSPERSVSGLSSNGKNFAITSKNGIARYSNFDTYVALLDTQQNLLEVTTVSSGKKTLLDGNHAEGVTIALAFSGDDKWLITLKEHGQQSHRDDYSYTMARWDTVTKKCVEEAPLDFVITKYSVGTYVTISPLARYIAVVGEWYGYNNILAKQFEITLIDPLTKKKLLLPTIDRTDYPPGLNAQGLYFYQDNQKFILHLAARSRMRDGFEDNVFEIWDIPTRQMMHTMRPQERYLDRLFMPSQSTRCRERNGQPICEPLRIIDDKLGIFAYGTSTSLQFWSAPTAQRLYEMPMPDEHGPASHAPIHFSKNGKTMAIHNIGNSYTFFKKIQPCGEAINELYTTSLLLRLLQVRLKKNKVGAKNVQESLDALYVRDKTLLERIRNILAHHTREQLLKVPPYINFEKVAARNKAACKAIKDEDKDLVYKALVYKKRLMLLQKEWSSLEAPGCTIL